MSRPHDHLDTIIVAADYMGWASRRMRDLEENRWAAFAPYELTAIQVAAAIFQTSAPQPEERALVTMAAEAKAEWERRGLPSSDEAR